MSVPYRALPDCVHCEAGQHDSCVPLVERDGVSTICRCFAAYPDSDEHENALFWWSDRMGPG